MNPAKTELIKLYAIVVLLERGKDSLAIAGSLPWNLAQVLSIFGLVHTQSSASCRWRVHTSSVWHRPLSSDMHLYMGLRGLDASHPLDTSLLSHKNSNLGTIFVFITLRSELIRACMLSGWCQGTFEPSGPFQLLRGACFSPTKCLSRIWPV